MRGGDFMTMEGACPNYGAAACPVLIEVKKKRSVTATKPQHSCLRQAGSNG